MSEMTETDKDFYEMNVTMSKMMYNELYKEDKFLEKWEKIK